MGRHDTTRRVGWAVPARARPGLVCARAGGPFWPSIVRSIDDSVVTKVASRGWEGRGKEGNSLTGGVDKELGMSNKKHFWSELERHKKIWRI